MVRLGLAQLQQQLQTNYEVARSFYQQRRALMLQTFNEKLQWLKLSDRKPEYKMMSDSSLKLTLKDLAVRIINRTFAHYLYLWTTNKKRWSWGRSLQGNCCGSMLCLQLWL